jgi:hypothetical protein
MQGTIRKNKEGYPCIAYTSELIRDKSAVTVQILKPLIPEQAIKYQPEWNGQKVEFSLIGNNSKIESWQKSSLSAWLK